MNDLSRFLRLEDDTQTVVELRDYLTPERRATIAEDVRSFDRVEAHPCKCVVTLAEREGRPVVLFEEGEYRCTVRGAVEGDPEEAWLGEGLRYADPAEVLSHALWLLRQGHPASFPRRFNWDRSEGIVLAHRRSSDLRRFARETLVDLGSYSWREGSHTSVVWRERDEALAPLVPRAALVAVGRHRRPLWGESRLRIIELAQEAEAFLPGNVHRLLERAPELDPHALDLRFLDPHVRSSGLVMVLASADDFEREIACTVARRCADGERLVVLFGPDATTTEGVDLAVRVDVQKELAVEALAALFEGVLGFDMGDLRTLGRSSAITGIAVQDAHSGRFQHLLGAAFDELDLTQTQLSRATAILLVVLAPYGTRLAELESLVAPVHGLMGPDATVLIQFVPREMSFVRLTVLVFESTSAA